VKLSGRQITLLLTSIWAQAISPENIPANYEAIAHTYSLLLLFSGSKVTLNYKFPLRYLYVLFVPCYEYLPVKEKLDTTSVPFYLSSASSLFN
jgi:hypothetical protein